MDEVLATVSPSIIRRYFGVGVLGILGLILIYVAFARPPDNFGLQVFLLGLGALILWGADTMRRASAVTLVLTHETLSDSTGRVLTRVDEIVSVDRSFLAFKPSNGFLVRLRTRQPRTWVPGLWWRFGRRIGVGGVTSARETRFMAEILTALVVERGMQ